MKKVIIFLLSLILLTACSVASPLTVTKQWLEQLEQNPEQAISLMVIKKDNSVQNFSDQDKQDYIKNFEKEYGQITEYSVQNAIPLNEGQLKDYGVTEGYEVYYTQWSKNSGEAHLKILVVKVDGKWKIVKP